LSTARRSRPTTGRASRRKRGRSNSGNGYCQAQAIQFTRGRPYKKDDNAHIEQKNWTHVRKLVGYDRYDSLAALAALNTLYADLRLLQNLWLPSVKLVTKTRVGSRVRRVYGPPQTPLDRVRACPSADPTKVAALVREQATLDPFALAARIERQQDRLYARYNKVIAVWSDVTEKIADEMFAEMEDLDQSGRNLTRSTSWPTRAHAVRSSRSGSCRACAG